MIKIGIELHAQIKSKRKLLSNASADYFGKPKNTIVEPYDMAMPGSMPDFDKEALVPVMKAVKALNFRNVAEYCVFDRKHYKYQDLPAGYQVTQHRKPLATDGMFCNVNLRQLHIEVDTAAQTSTGLDYNRCGVGLMEIVTQPDIKSAKEAGAFIKSVQETLQHIGASNARMDEGSFRADININVGDSFKTELKNLRSIKSIVRAIEFEVNRHQTEPTIEETRGFNEITGKTYPLRTKNKYVYIPEHDIFPVKVDCVVELPEMLCDIRERLGAVLSEQFVEEILRLPGVLQHFDRVFSLVPHIGAKLVFDWIIHLPRSKLSGLEISPRAIASIPLAIYERKINTAIGTRVLDHFVKHGAEDSLKAAENVAKGRWTMISDPRELRAIAQQIMDANPPKKEREQYIEWIVKQAQKTTGGLVDVATLRAVLSE